MDYNEKYSIIEELGKGGQGIVYQVIPIELSDDRLAGDLLPEIGRALDTSERKHIYNVSEMKPHFKHIKNAILKIIMTTDVKNHKALKCPRRSQRWDGYRGTPA